MKNNKKKRWIRLRHRVVKGILWLLLTPFAKIKYGIKVNRFKEEGKRIYLVLSNHQTAFDQFFLGMAFKQHLYYVASEDLFSNGFVSKLIKFLVGPIPIKKSTTDVKAVMNCLRVAKEGGSIALFPEGNRTYSGKTEYIKESCADLAKALKLPIAFFHIEGGYGVHPRWSDTVRKGKMRGYVHSVMEYDEYSQLTNEELYREICKRLYVNEGNSNSIYKGKKRAEYLERAMYFCPNCHISEWESNKSTIKCKNCSTAVEYTETTELKPVTGNFPYRFVTEWYEAQSHYVSSLDLSSFGLHPICSDFIKYTEVIPYKKKICISKDAKFTMYNDKFVIKYGNVKEEIYFDTVTSMAVLGRNKINMYIKDKIFQIKSGKRFCALKYVNLYFHYINSKKEVTNGEFLGL